MTYTIQKRVLVVLWLLTLLLLCLTMSYAHAADIAVTASPGTTQTITIPWGDWLAQLLAALRDSLIFVVGAIVTWLCRKLPTQIGTLIGSRVSEQLLTRAVDYGIAAIEGATKGSTLNVTTTNAILAAAEQYVATNGSFWIKQFVDSGTLRSKLLARLGGAALVGPDVSAARVGATLPPV